MAGITLISDYMVPETNSTEDIASADRGIQFQVCIYIYTLYTLKKDSRIQYFKKKYNIFKYNKCAGKIEKVYIFFFGLE